MYPFSYQSLSSITLTHSHIAASQEISAHARNAETTLSVPEEAHIKPYRAFSHVIPQALQNL
jgi:hypothetical protein